MAGLPPGASTPPASGQAASFDESPKLGGFDLSFFLPFSRQELYSELLVADNPLGSSPNVTFEILRAGYSGEVSTPPRRQQHPLHAHTLLACARHTLLASHGALALLLAVRADLARLRAAVHIRRALLADDKHWNARAVGGVEEDLCMTFSVCGEVRMY